jgi:hypothetical protein
MMITFNQNHDEKLQLAAIMCQNYNRATNGRCGYEGEGCAKCTYNVTRLTGGDETQAALYHVGASAFSHMQAVCHVAMIMLIAFAIIWFAVPDGCSNDTPTQAYAYTAPQETVRAQQTYVASTADEWARVKPTVDSVVWQTVADVKRDGDVDGDKIVTCVDYAIRFHELYPSSRIIVNYNPSKNFNHLFNAIVLSDGSKVYIEPQGAKNGSYLIRDVWGSKYDKSFNKDETWKWARGNQGGYGK